MVESWETEGGCGTEGEEEEEEADEGRETPAALREGEGWREIGPEGLGADDLRVDGLGLGAAVDAGVRAGTCVGVGTGTGAGVGAGVGVGCVGGVVETGV